MRDLQLLPEKELLLRIYAAQLRTKMDVETIMHNVEHLRRKVDPEAFDRATNPDWNSDNPHTWRPMETIFKDMEDDYDLFISDLTKLRSDGAFYSKDFLEP